MNKEMATYKSLNRRPDLLVRSLIAIVAAAVGGSVAAFATYFYTLKDFIDFENPLSLLEIVNRALNWALPIVGLVAVATFLLRYLDQPTTNELPEVSSDVVMPTAGIEQEVQRALENKVDHLLDEANREQLLTELGQRLRSKATEEMLNDIAASVEKSIRSGNEHDLIQAERERAVRRLVGAIDSLRARANVNLVFGIIMSLIGITILASTLTNPLGDTSSRALLSHYVPRIALAFVVELFSYFFLNLYRANLAETRYYHNEITNVEARCTALTTAYISGVPEFYGDIVRALLATERNGTLSKGQTTVELARAKIELDSNKDLTNSLLEAVSTLAGKKVR
ncbi:hypothetical protein [Paraburkholderia caffeinilytica]|uniref:MotA/TolQ/ExbB proton channel domain-containing protein n=1 Tax=Paraburkholderia caffeinilytica TaxID=1761016 RepID=A0ABQ1M613_9BURK|nr:hypothetical protein [Paraburkholderia caffeinilytica]GGC35529.1 hypothetical protein GCM10011400_22710 [Paraburkholderia caffeinilytica]CAB3794304.1 hypothetical protein LMG28690_03902 [Paraburkholderia caffeinilytica]